MNFINSLLKIGHNIVLAIITPIVIIKELYQFPNLNVSNIKENAIIVAMLAIIIKIIIMVDLIKLCMFIYSPLISIFFLFVVLR